MCYEKDENVTNVTQTLTMSLIKRKSKMFHTEMTISSFSLFFFFLRFNITLRGVVLMFTFYFISFIL